MTLISYLLTTIFLGSSLIQASNVTDYGIHIRIYDNIAEILQPISPFDLPVNYSQQEWTDIRTDSFRLIGKHVNIYAQSLYYNETTTNGQKILIQRSTHNETYTPAIMIDETRNLVHDLVDNTYYVLTPDRIRYLSTPFVRRYFVDFIFDLKHDEQLYLRYLQNNIKWQVRYDLQLEMNDTDSILQAYADIRNDGSSLLMIDSAELIAGDVNIRSSSYSSASYNDYSGFGSAGVASDQQIIATTTYPTPIISQSEELAGLYIFTINDTFILDPHSNYILPMFRPTIDIERYGLIDKYFQRMDRQGNAQRAYRLRVPDKYLPKGHVFVRESDRLVGETTWSDYSANETNEFYLGEDPDLQFIESIQLISRRQAYEANGYRFILSTYSMNLRLINSKKRPMDLEYRLRFSSQDNLTLKENTNDTLLQVDGSVIVGLFQLNANDEQEFKFTFETQ
ncbi:unnamed protein product [Adineta ricciae]|uniref:Uncharacterized protein n=1 Tax=Adineta ricciae TaxID=249248 RepID=A0A814BPR2_ADIRI|nr:unnamed protein product [Adineta ricciae]CAF0930737.1 unnamed protein product [Adineta ricciae]